MGDDDLILWRYMVVTSKKRVCYITTQSYSSYIRVIGYTLARYINPGPLGPAGYFRILRRSPVESGLCGGRSATDRMVSVKCDCRVGIKQPYIIESLLHR